MRMSSSKPLAPQSINGLLSPPLTPGKHIFNDPLAGGGDSGHGDHSPEQCHHPPRVLTPESPDVHDKEPESLPMRSDIRNGDFNLRQRKPQPGSTLDVPEPRVPHTHRRRAGSDRSRSSRSRSRSRCRSHADDEASRGPAPPRISLPVELMRNSYDCVVIGSGYGGGVAASRMARAGQSVCVLERGLERWPGEYPAGTADALAELHCSGSFAPYSLKGKILDGENPTGMYHLIFGRGQSAVVCNGLGGTSLINANVFMEADSRTLGMKMWPPEIRNDVDGLKKYYQKVEEVLEPEEYPDHWPDLKKLDVLKKQAEYLGLGENFKKVRQTTRFKNGPNSCGVEMSPSSLSGQDATGVNDGSKTTTLVTYLADAWNWGAEMFCECEVRHVEKAEDREGYIIYFAWHGRNRGHFKANLHGDLMWVHAKEAVFFGAGSIGTTEILLRSKAMGLGMSDQVGLNMSGNGDILAFGYNTDETINSMGQSNPSPYSPVGPTISGVIDCRDKCDNPLDGFVIEEGAVPEALSHFLQIMLDLMPGSKKPNEEGIVERTQAALARYGSRFLGPYYKRGALEKTQVYLVMSHDSSQAMLTLQDDKPVLEFLGVGRSNHVKKLNALLEKATEAVGGTLVQSPFFALMGQQQVTVHPIGGAYMARDGTGATGAVNHAGELFSGLGSETHKGLIVTDGAVVPVALGANPLATIAALAERSLEHYAAKRGLTVSQEKNGLLDLFGEPQHMPPAFEECDGVETDDESQSIMTATDVMDSAAAIKDTGFGFTEVMSGFIHQDERMKEDNRETYELAHRTAKRLCESARFFLSVQAYSTNVIVNDAQHRGMLTGTFVCPTIPGSPFMVQRGEFNLFILDLKAPGTRNLTYDFDMTGANGKKLHFHGYKVVDSSVAFSPMGLWRSTTTLYVTVSECVPGMTDDLDDEEAWRRGKVLAKGIMHIQPADFLSEIMTMTPTGSSLLTKVMGAASFLTFFTRSHYINSTEPDQTVAVHASDGVRTRMLIWEPTSYPDDDERNIRNLFMIPGAAVDHQIFALPTIPFNAVNYFTRAGYRVFVTVHRIGQLVVARDLYTTYDARLDLKACLEHIREEYGPSKVYTIAHCMGSVAFSAGLLDGTIPADWILGVSCSQVFMNPIWNTMNMIKIMASPVPMDKLYTWLGGTWFNCSTSRGDTLVQWAINQVLRFMPDERRELCNNAACHRTSFVFGRCWNHRNLNEATHRQIDRFFGGVNMRLLHLLMRQGFEGHTMSNAPACEDLTTDANVERLKGVPFLLFVGRDNAVLSPEATERTYEILCDRFGADAGAGSDVVEYRRRVVPGYGHLDCWMGRNAWKDVYPFVREEVDRVTRGETYRFREPDDKFKRMVESGELLY